MNGISPFDNLLTTALDNTPNINLELELMSKENLKNTLALTPAINTLNSDASSGGASPKFDVSSLDLNSIAKIVKSGSPHLKYAPRFSPYDYAKKYDSPILGFTPDRSYQQQEDMYADYYQSGFGGGLKTLGKGLASRVPSIATKIAQGFGHVGGGIVDILDGDAFKGKWNYAVDNFVVNAMSSADEGLREALPIYADSDYFNGGMWDKVFTGKFLADDMFDGLAYAASSFINVPILGQLGKIAGGLAKGAGALGKLESVAAITSKLGKLAEPIGGFASKAFSSETALGNTLIKANKLLTENKLTNYLTAPVESGTSRIASWAKTGAYTAFNTVSEAGAEAYDLKKTLKEDLISQGYSEVEAEKIALARAQETFNGNLIGLAASNLWELKTVFPKMFNSSSSDIKTLQKLVRSGTLTPEEMSVFKGTLKKLGTGIAVEGFYEENFQTSLQQYEKRKALGGADEESFADVISGVFSNMTKNANAFRKGMFGGYQTLSQDEKEGADSILLGAVIGMGMGGLFNALDNKKQKNFLIDYKKAYNEFGNYQHSLFNMLGDDKRNLLKVFTKNNPDGTTSKTYLNENGEYEYDMDNIAKLTLFNLENKKLYNEYMQRVALGDEAGAAWLLDQAFARLAYQSINNKFWQGDRKEAIEDLKLKIKDFQMPEDAEDLGLQEELQKRLEHVDNLLSLHEKIDNDLTGFDSTNQKDAIQRKYSESAMFYEASKIDSLNRLRDKYNEQVANGDTQAVKKIEELDKIIEDAKNVYQKFLNKDSRDALFKEIEDNATNIKNLGDQFNSFTRDYNELLNEKNEFVKNIPAGEEDTDDNKNKIEEYDKKLDEIIEKRSLIQYQFYEEYNKKDFYTKSNRMMDFKTDPVTGIVYEQYKTEEDILKNFNITREASIYFNSLNDTKTSSSVDALIDSFDLSQVKPLPDNINSMIDALTNDIQRINIVIIQLDSIKDAVIKLKNKQNPTSDDLVRLDKLKVIYTTLYNSISIPNMDDVKSALQNSLKDIIDDLNDYGVTSADPFTETDQFIQDIEDFLNMIKSLDPNDPNISIVEGLLDNFKNGMLANLDRFRLIDSIISRDPNSNVNFNVALGSTYNGHSFNPQDYKGISIKEYEQIQDQDNWLNRAIMVDEIAAAQTIIDTYQAKLADDDLSSFDTNPNTILEKLEMLYGIRKSVQQDDRKDNDNYAGVEDKINELIPILEDALQAARLNTNIREIEQAKYNSFDKINKFTSIGVSIDPQTGTHTINNVDLANLIRAIIGSKYDELLENAKNDQTDPYSQLYYELILDEIRRSTKVAEVKALKQYLTKIKSDLAAATNKRVETLLTLGSNKLQIPYSQKAIKNGFFTEVVIDSFLSVRRIWSFPKVIQDFLADSNFSSLIFELNNNPNLDLKVIHNETGTVIELDKDQLLNIALTGSTVNNIVQLENDLNVSLSYNINAYFLEQKKLADNNAFSLSQQQRIAELELTKRFRSNKSDPDNVRDFFFFLNAVAGSGKTNGVGKWFVSKLGLKEEQILVTSHLPKSSEIAKNAMAPNQDDTIIYDVLEAFKKLDQSKNETVIQVNGKNIDLKTLKLLVIDEMAALGSSENYATLIKMIKYVNKVNENSKFTVIGLGDVNQLTNDASGIAQISLPLGNGSITSLPRLTISYRSAVTAISDVFSMFKGKSALVENISVSASESIGTDAFGVHAVGTSTMQPIDAITKQLTASIGGKLIITTAEKKAAYQAAFPDVTVYTPEEAQSFTEENVFIDLPIEGNQEVYNKKMYVSISRASKYAMVVDYTNTFKQSENKNMRSIIEEDRKENDAKILDNKTKYLSLLDHYLKILGASTGTSAGPTPVTTINPAPPNTGSGSGQRPGGKGKGKGKGNMTPQQQKEQEFDTLVSTQPAVFQTLVQNNQRYFELFRKEYAYGKLDPAEESEMRSTMREMVKNFTPDTEKSFDDFCKQIPC